MNSSRTRFVQSGGWIVWAILLLAIVLRVTYLAKTPYSVREHDVNAHIQYIEYMATEWRVPPAADGWEYYQPPLYYVMAGSIWSAGSAAGWERDTLLFAVQLFTVVLSILFVGIAWWIAALLFPGKRMAERAVFLLMIAVFPGLLLASSRVSNDGLAVVTAGLVLALLLRWYRDGRMRDWYLLAAALALALLTKMTAILFVPVVLGLFLWKERARWRKAFVPLVMFGLILTALVAWYPVVRMHEQGDHAAIPGTEGLDPGVLLPTTPRNFLTFNPVKIVEIPYLNPWSDESRRQFFWEYFFRSAFLGEWNFGDDMRFWSRAMLTGGLGMLALAVIGAGAALRRGREGEWWVLPVVMVALAVLAGAVGYRFVNTCSCAQDFRYSFPLVIPWSVFAAVGIAALPGGWKRMGWAWILCFVLTVCVFLALIPGMR